MRTRLGACVTLALCSLLAFSSYAEYRLHMDQWTGREESPPADTAASLAE